MASAGTARAASRRASRCGRRRGRGPGAGLARPPGVSRADGGHRVAHTAVHIHGGVGIDLEYPLHRYFIAAKHHEFALGGATTQLRRIGAALATAG